MVVVVMMIVTNGGGDPRTADRNATTFGNSESSLHTISEGSLTLLAVWHIYGIEFAQLFLLSKMSSLSLSSIRNSNVEITNWEHYLINVRRPWDYFCVCVSACVFGCLYEIFRPCVPASYLHVLSFRCGNVNLVLDTVRTSGEAV